METHHLIFIGLLSALLLPKRTRYASSIYLVPYVPYLFFKSYILTEIPQYYHAISATLNLFIFIFLLIDYKANEFSDLFNWHKYTVNQKVGLLSFLLMFVNLIGWMRYENGFTATIYNSDYRFIVAVQISLLYIGNMIDAWADRGNQKRDLVRLINCDSFEVSCEIHQEEKG